MIAVFAALFLAKTVLTEVIGNRGDPLTWLVLGGGSTLVAAGLCLAARTLVLPHCSAAVRPWIVVSVYLLAGWSRNFLQLISSDALSVPYQQTSFQAPMVSSLVVMTLTGVSVGRARDHRAQMNRLLETEARLTQASENFQRQVTESNKDLRQQVRGYLGPAIVTIRALLDEKDDTSPHALSNLLAATVTDVVRPLTQNLSGPLTTEIPLIRDGKLGQTFRFLSARVDAPHAIRPISVMLIMLAALATQPVQLSVDARHPRTLLLLLASCVALAAIKRLWPRRFSLLSIPLAGACLIAAFSLSLLLPSTVLSLISPGFMLSVTNSLTITLTYWLLLGLCCSLPLLYLQLGQQDERHAESNITELGLMEARFRRQLWMNRRNLSWVLHGPIQSALVSSALSLSGSRVTDDDRERVRSSLAAALNQLDSSSTAHPDLPTALAALTTVWSRSCTVSWQITTEAQALLDHDRDAVICVGELVREGVSNAVRHGSASCTEIEIDEHDAMLRVSVRDNGTGLSPDVTPGLGSGMFDEITRDWSRVTSDGHTTLLAWIPTAAAGAVAA